MSVEKYRPPSAQKELPKRSLFDYYSVSHEVTFAQRQIQKGVSQERIALYLHNNVLRFLEEFAGKVKHARISYFWNQGNLEYCGVADPIRKTYKRRALHSSFDGREQAEAEGFETIESVFQKRGADIAFWISPPSFGVEGFGDYGFVFILINRPDRVDELIVRYPHETAQFDKSAQIFSFLSKEEVPHHQENERFFLKQPIFVKISDPNQTPYSYINANLSSLGLIEDKEAIGAFTKTIEQDAILQSWIHEYQMTVMGLATHQNSSFLLQKARQYISAIYQRALDIQKHLEQKGHASSFIRYNSQLKALPFPETPQELRALFMQYGQTPPMIMGGGSCPSAKEIDTIFQSDESFFKQAQRLFDMKDLLKNKNYFDCPECRKPIPYGEGIETCPHCGITKEKYALKTGILCA